MIDKGTYFRWRAYKMSRMSPGLVRELEHYEAVQITRTKYSLACEIRRIRSQTHTERQDCIAAIKAAKQGSFLPLIVDVDERMAATRLCGPKMMANAVESERLRWADPLAFRQRSKEAEYSPRHVLIIHHREAIASFRLCRRLP